MKKRFLKQIYHPYWLWEETKFNMWGDVENHDTFLRRAIKFTGDHKLYGRWMKKVIKDWKYSCEHNLSNNSSNRQAYIGHAACAYAFKCPEHIVREAWWHLTDEQRTLANKEADNAIESWERNNKYLIINKYE